MLDYPLIRMNERQVILYSIRSVGKSKGLTFFLGKSKGPTFLCREIEG